MPANTHQANAITEQMLHSGYLLVEDLLSAQECARVAQRLQDYAGGLRPPPTGMSVHREPALQQSDHRHEGGGDVRKIAGLYTDELLRELIADPRITIQMRALLGDRLRLYRADALMKPAAVGSAKGVHQDSPYWPIQPMSLWSCWIPFDDATIENGCMMVIPGSHRGGALPHVSEHGDYVIPLEDYDGDALIPVPMKRGTGLFFHSLLVHGTAANRSGNPRRAVTMSYFGAEHRDVKSGTVASYPAID